MMRNCFVDYNKGVQLHLAQWNMSDIIAHKELSRTKVATESNVLTEWF